MPKWIQKIGSVFLSAFMLLSVAACSSSQDGLSGNWVLSGNDSAVMSFNSNGSADNVLYTDSENGAVTGYSVKDGNLVLKFTNGAESEIVKTDSEESALKNFDEYYLDGDTLVFRRRIYYREGSETPDETVADADTTETGQEEQIDVSDLPGSVEGGQKYLATISVENYGDITVELDEGIAPVTVQNFVDLANSGFYNGLTFHRIIDGFMIQGGDPLGNGTGGSDETIYGEFLENGFNNTLSHTRGVISMARSADYDSASSQFFIVHEDSTFLDGQYAAFGHVVDGMDVVDEIATTAKPTDGNGTIDAADQPIITSITVEAI